LAHGADIIDIGGQSTRPAGFTGLPGYTPVDEEVELERVLPIVTELRKQSDAIISIDTFSPYVLENCLKAGVDILNSIWGIEEASSGFSLPKSSHTSLIKIATQYKCPVIIMHNKVTTEYPNGLVNEVKDFLLQSARKAAAARIPEEHIVLDPGIGFGKTPAQSLELLSHLKEFTALGFPTLLGTSRKSFIGKLIDKVPKERVYGTAATVALAVAAGIDIIRAHDVAQMSDCIKVSDAIVRTNHTEH
jgi:dihydropteroate synthase